MTPSNIFLLLNLESNLKKYVMAVLLKQGHHMCKELVLVLQVREKLYLSD